MIDITIHYKKKDIHFNNMPKDMKKAILNLLYSIEQEENFMFSDEQSKEKLDE